MKKYYYFTILLLTIFSSGCKNSSNSTEPLQGQFEIRSALNPITIDVNTDSLQADYSPIYSIEYSALKIKGIDLSIAKYYYPKDVDKEFILSTNKRFSVEIRNCKKESRWIIDTGDNNSSGWINKDISLIQTDTLFNSDNTLTYRCTFQTLKSSKGYICFSETDKDGSSSSDDSHGLVIGYDINPLDKLTLNINDITWKYNTAKGSFSKVSVKLKGTTNAYRLRGMANGDGLATAIEIPIQNNNFDIEIPVAFSHVEGVALETSTKLLLYGTVGLPRVITLKNPRSPK